MDVKLDKTKKDNIQKKKNAQASAEVPRKKRKWLN